MANVQLLVIANVFFVMLLINGGEMIFFIWKNVKLKIYLRCE